MQKKIVFMILVIIITLTMLGSSHNELKYQNAWFEHGEFLPITHGGTCEKINFFRGSKYWHSFWLYKPYDYSPDKKYNVLIILNCQPGEARDLMDKTWDIWYGEPFRFIDIYDQLNSINGMEQFIVVAPDYLTWWDCPVSYWTVAKEIKEKMIPYIVNNYSTYAKNSDFEEIIKAREHVAIGGVSFGGMYIFSAVMAENLEYCANFFPMSASANTIKSEDILLKKYKKFPIKNLCYTQGSLEKWQMEKTYMRFITNFPEIFNNNNSIFFHIQGTAHYYHTWAIGIWNSCIKTWLIED